MVIMHLCDNTLCLNPSHLKLGTYRENTIDMYNKNRDNNGMRGINHKESSKKLLSKAKQSLNEGQLFQIKKLLLEKTNEKVTEKRKRIGSLFNVSDKTIGRIERGLAPWYSEILNGGLSDWIKEV
jgi:rare lipoprotein A (peptidoglycan hydrolase)